MIPRNLPALVQAGLLNGWEIRLASMALTASVHARFTFYNPLSGLHSHAVELEWMDGRIVDSTINDVPTPYRQCAALIREGA